MYHPEEVPYQLAVRDLDAVCKRYADKDIAVVVNFASNPKKYRNLIEQRIIAILAPAVAAIMGFMKTDSDLNYEHALAEIARNEYGNFDYIPKPIRQKLKAIVKQNGISNLDDSNLATAHKILKENLSVAEIQEIQKLIIENQRTGLLKDSSLDLSIEFAAEEIREIQGKLKAGNSIGYYFTAGEWVNRKHFEVLIISKDKVIKPVSWLGIENEFRIYDPKIQLPFFETRLISYNDYHKTYSSAEPVKPRAQSGPRECGTLGGLYLKELLKNKSEILKDYTLQFAWKNQEGKEEYYFFPCPQALRYSQSSFYNQCIEAMLKEGDAEGFVEVVHENKTLRLRTLKAFLQTKPDENKEMLKNLAGFKEKWLAAYHEAIKKRSKKDGEKYNQYLAYKTNTILKKSVRVFRKEPDMYREGGDFYLFENDELFYIDKEKNKTTVTTLQDPALLTTFLSDLSDADSLTLYLESGSGIEFSEIIGTRSPGPKKTNPTETLPIQDDLLEEYTDKAVAQTAMSESVLPDSEPKNDRNFARFTPFYQAILKFEQEFLIYYESGVKKDNLNTLLARIKDCYEKKEDPQKMQKLLISFCVVCMQKTKHYHLFTKQTTVGEELFECMRQNLPRHPSLINDALGLNYQKKEASCLSESRYRYRDFARVIAKTLIEDKTILMDLKNNTSNDKWSESFTEEKTTVFRY